MTVTRAEYEAAGAALGERHQANGGWSSYVDLATAAVDASGLAERLTIAEARVEQAAEERNDALARLADAIAARDRLEGAYELAHRETVLQAAALRESRRELTDALDQIGRHMAGST